MSGDTKSTGLPRRRGKRDPLVSDPSVYSNKEELDAELQEGLEETFPASDPVAATGTTRAGRPAGATNRKPPSR